MAAKAGARKTVRSGPWSGVYRTKDPQDSGPEDRLVDARNLYWPDPTNHSDAYQRPGFVLLNNGSQFPGLSGTFKGQGVWTQFDTDGVAYNFCVFGGKLYRLDSTLSIATDVTPVGVTIDPAITTRVYFGSMGGVMAATDGVHRPWVASNLASTPITGTYIDFDGIGTAWTAYGPPAVFGGSGFFILNTVNGVAARLDIAWGEPNDWTIGYQQTNYDNRWTVEQTATAPLFGLCATNVALYYFRQASIGSISGTVGPDLASTATHDSVSLNVGTGAPQTIVLFGDTIYFCDVIGRPWRFPIGGVPQPIWHQLRGLIDTSETAYPAINAYVATATFDPTLNQYCVAPWTSAPGSSSSPVEWQTFDAVTGNYVGPWSIGSVAVGPYVDCLGSFTDVYGRATLVVLGSLVPGGASGYAWGMSALVGVADFIGTEDLDIITTEGGVKLTIEGQSAVWKDNGVVPLIEAQTDRLGYSDDLTWLFDQATILSGTDSPIAITALTPAVAQTAVGTPTPVASQDEIFRTTCGLDIQGRGIQVTVSPTTATEQWSLSSISVIGMPSKAEPDDP